MIQSPVAVKKIEKLDPYTFSIKWSDGRQHNYRLSELQQNCPCAGCVEGVKSVDENVKAKRIVSVGRYALRAEFVTGCSSGIYDFDLLRQLKQDGDSG